MKVAELLQEKAGLSKVGAWPNAFLTRMYNTFYVDAKDLPSPEDKKPTLKDLEKKVYVSIGQDGTYAAIGVWKSGGFSNSKGPRLVTFKDGKAADFALDKMADALKQFPKGTYFSLPYSANGYYTTRAKHAADISSDRISDKAGTVMKYMNDVFLPKLKEKAEQTIDRVYANLRKVSNKTDGWTYSKSDQDNILAAVKALEEMMSNGFNRKQMEEFLRRHDRLSHGWGSIPNNYYEFTKMMDEPAAKAKFAKVILDAINGLDKELTRVLNK